MGSLSSQSESASLSWQRLKDKVAIVTGGASGLGESICRLFALNGAKVIIADVQDDKGQTLCKQIRSDGNSATYHHCDITKDSEMESLVNFTVLTYGKLDIMFNNAGITGTIDPTITGTSIDNFRKVFEVNVHGAFLGAKHAARVMIPTRTGVILFTSSIASVFGGESPHAYTASKHAVVGLMKSLCVELGEYGIRVNAVSPCAVSTPLLRNAMGRDKEFVDEVIHDAAVLKGVVPCEEDIAAAGLFLASDEGRYVSGVNFVVDGGYTVTNRSFNRVLGMKMMNNGH